ncbi:MAG: hypothetical protein D6732_20970 [Methanobacteriota archaeon]|nr:MAG: hypothetical protein D6732_20970 [Euryarchaeota archaeon]
MEKELEELLDRLREISEKGYIPTRRKGNTGVGMTLEAELGIAENNRGSADWKGIIELKAQREDTPSKITLFTKSPRRIVSMKWADIVLKYGYQDQNGRWAIYRTFSTQRSVEGWRLRTQQGQLILSYEETDIGAWNLDDLFDVLRKKLQGTVFVFAKTRKIDNIEHFHYHRYMIGERIRKNRFLRMLEKGEIVVDFRMYVREDGTCRDHGTAFRIAAGKIPDLFDETTENRL